MIDIEKTRQDKTLDFQAHKLYYTHTDLISVAGQGVNVKHNYKVNCPLDFIDFEVSVKRCEKCKYLDGKSHNGIYCLFVKFMKLCGAKRKK